MKRFLYFILFIPFLCHAAPTASRAYVDRATNALAGSFSGKISSSTNALYNSLFEPKGDSVGYYDIPIKYYFQATTNKYFEIFQYRMGAYNVLNYNGIFTLKTFSNKTDGIFSRSILFNDFYSGSWIDEDTVSFSTSPGRVRPSGTLSASADGWPEGHSCFVVIDPQAAYVPADGLHLVGYSTWPTNATQSVWWRCGTNFYVNLLCPEL